MRVSSLSVVLGLVAFGHFAACSAGSDGSSSGGGGNGTGGSSASGGSAGSAAGGTNAGGTAGSAAGGTAGTASGGGSASGGTAGSAAGGGGGLTDAGIPDVTFTYDGPVEQDGSVGDACAATTVKAESAPLDMYIMFDNSTSMGTDCNLGSTTASKWCYSINALDTFFKSVSAGNGVALQYFPKCWKSQAECSTGASCAVAEVPLGQLPGNLTALETSLNNNLPNGTTPTEAALRGLAQYTTANKQAGREMIGILITDGVPEACDTNVNTLAGIVQAHYQNDKIKTFVIGMTGADYNKLEAIASPGGASAHTANCGGGIGPTCFHYDVGNGNAAAFTAVLQAIQKSAVACQYNMPSTDAGIVDPTKVEVQYSVGGVPPAQKLPHVNDANSCGSGGWYYDSNSNPKTLYLCPNTCSVVQVDSNAKIDISLGCLGS